jgi:predicted GIY-YIG superfamily endonuclease
VLYAYRQTDRQREREREVECKGVLSAIRRNALFLYVEEVRREEGRKEEKKQKEYVKSNKENIWEERRSSDRYANCCVVYSVL